MFGMLRSVTSRLCPLTFGNVSPNSARLSASIGIPPITRPLSSRLVARWRQAASRRNGTSSTIVYLTAIATAAATPAQR